MSKTGFRTGQFSFIAQHQIEQGTYTDNLTDVFYLLLGFLASKFCSHCQVEANSCLVSLLLSCLGLLIGCSLHFLITASNSLHFLPLLLHALEPIYFDALFFRISLIGLSAAFFERCFQIHCIFWHFLLPSLFESEHFLTVNSIFFDILDSFWGHSPT